MNSWRRVCQCASAPHPPEGTQVEGGGQDTPLRRHVGDAAQQEPPRRLLHLDDAEDRLHQMHSAPVRFPGLLTTHPPSTPAQQSVVWGDLDSPSFSAVRSADAECRTRPAHRRGCSIHADYRFTSSVPAGAVVSQSLSFRARVAVFIVDEQVFVVWSSKRAPVRLRHHNPLPPASTFLKAASRVVTRIG